MNKIVIFSTDIYNDLDEDNKQDFKNKMQMLINEGNSVVFTSRDDTKLQILKNTINISEINYIQRNQLKYIINNNVDKANYFIVVGNRDADLYMAATNKLFYIVPEWCINYDEKANKYGIKVNTLKKLFMLIKIIQNQNSWFYRLDLDEKSTILSLTNANTYGRHSTEEIEMINGFREFLKDGNKKYYEILLYHFLSAISNNLEFRDIKDWSIFPSSTTALNEDMFKFKEKARQLMNGKNIQNILIRHTDTWKSHECFKYNKDRIPCDRHFDTIIINPEYKGKLRDRTICIFDDYLTNGTSFETVRNLLMKEGVKKMFLVSLGKFHKNSQQQYFQQNYIIEGEVYEKGYRYSLQSSMWQDGSFNYNAVNEIENLHDIMYE